VIIERIDDPGLTARIGQSASFGHRSEGLHVSEIYKRLMVRLEPKKYGTPIDDPARRRMEVGIVFENMLEQGLVEKYATQRVGEIVSEEGIIMSPDGVNPALVAGEEYKATWKSCRHGLVDSDGAPLKNFLVWFIQMKAYGKPGHLGLNDWLLRVLFVNGDYSWHAVPDCYEVGPCAPHQYRKKPICGGGDCPCGPLFHSYKIFFSDEEMEDNWRMLLNIAREEGLL
jgi:hypothetical protein